MDEEIDLTSDDGEESTLFFPPLAGGDEPGLLVRVEYTSEVAAPIIEDGVVKLPPAAGGDAPLASFDEWGDKAVPGLLGGVVVEQGRGFRAEQGVLYVPLASSDSSVGEHVAGLVRNIGYKHAGTEPSIENGEIAIPLAHSYFGSTGIAGVIRGVQCGSTTTPSIDEGEVVLPYDVQGVVNANGEAVDWLSLPTAVGSSGVLLSEFPLFDGAVKLYAGRVGSHLSLTLVNE